MYLPILSNVSYSIYPENYTCKGIIMDGDLFLKLFLPILSVILYIFLEKIKNKGVYIMFSDFIDLLYKCWLKITEISIEYKDKIEGNNKCRICYDEIKDITFLPCKHLLTCNKCYNKFNTCPVCRENIKETIKVYNC